MLTSSQIFNNRAKNKAILGTANTVVEMKIKERGKKIKWKHYLQVNWGEIWSCEKYERSELWPWCVICFFVFVINSSFVSFLSCLNLNLNSSALCFICVKRGTFYFEKIKCEFNFTWTLLSMGKWRKSVQSLCSITDFLEPDPFGKLNLCLHHLLNSFFVFLPQFGS